jgi:N-acyl-D-aspartate/D-glutamate deacylase
VRERGVFTLEAMVHRLSDVPARLYGLKDRGRIAEGAWADVIVFDPATVGASPMTTVRDLPAGAPRLTSAPVGVQDVVINGSVVVEGGTPTGELPGRLIRSGRDTTTVRASGSLD